MVSQSTSTPQTAVVNCRASCNACTSNRRNSKPLARSSRWSPRAAAAAACGGRQPRRGAGPGLQEEPARGFGPQNRQYSQLFDLQPTVSLADLCQVNGLIDRDMVERALARHDSGVHLLASPRRQDSFIATLNRTDPGLQTNNTADSLRQTLGMSRFMFPYIVIDHGATFSEELLQALRMARLGR